MTEATTTPQYDLGKRLSNWGRWGEDDEIGTLNFVTPEKRIQAGGLIKTGKVFDLGMAFDSAGPQLGTYRNNPIHTMTRTPLDASARGSYISSDDMITMGLQCATQWDSLAHVGYDGRFYNDAPASIVTTASGATRNSIDKTMTRLISRGVLLDIARLKGVERLPDSYAITSADLIAAEERQGVQVQSGDFALIRTGEYQYFLEGNRARYSGNAAGMGLDSAQWIFDREVASIVLDNWACEAWPSSVAGSVIPFHEVAIRDIGILIGEMFNLEELATDCEQDGVWELPLAGTGLKVTGAVGSPVTPMAIK